MSGHSKRKSPPAHGASSPSQPKRQRMSPAVRDSASRAGRSSAAPSRASTSAAAPSPRDSLSSLSPTNSRQSTPEPASVAGASATVMTAGSSKLATVDTAAPSTTGTEDDGEAYEEENDDDDDDDGQTEAIKHPTQSAKTVPGKQPRPLEPATGANANSAPTLGHVSQKQQQASGNRHPTQGGKGRKGEQALEHAVAAREEVERRRVELKNAAAASGGAVAVGVAGARDVDDPAAVKTEEVEEVVVTGEEAEDLTAPASLFSSVHVDLITESRPKRERPAIAEERAGIIQFRVVTNDGKPDSMIILTGLKNVFQKQLPKMPREYIARLVFDRAHWSMAIVKRGLEVVGGITYRPFEGQEFAEIVFCAITGTEQVKASSRGYGSHMMNHFKDHVKASTRCMHFLTYADNYAIGYFKKQARLCQGFTKEIALDRKVWAGYIKDYEGGTIMHCAMLPRVKYLDVANILSEQREVILSKIRALSTSHVVHQGLDAFKKLEPGQSLDPSMVPGLKESGWTPEMDELTRRPKRPPHFAVMKKLLTLLVDHPSSWAFANPVNAAEVTDYYDVIKQPMDLATMENKLEANTYNTLPEFIADAKLIFSNCRQYNDLGSNYVKNANKLEAYLNEQVKIYSDE
ncbi:histone acetyltransferase [Microbotryomycetes sp. JL201]|nr:histone acetyltransferase [Microbotryomycetes sp. JL201]